MKLEKRMVVYLVLAGVVGVFATFNREHGSLYMGFMILSFTIITTCVRSTYLLVLKIARKLDGAAKDVVLEPSKVLPPKHQGSDFHVGGNHGHASVR
jgi:hypothetical protein